MPYRSAPLPRPESPSPRRAWGAVVVLVVGAATVFAGRRFEQTRRQQNARERVIARAVEAAHARTMVSDERQVMVLDDVGERARVVRVPGRLVRRGTDVVRVPEVIAAPGAVALMPDGAWAIDSDGQLFDVSSGAAVAACRLRRPCVAQSVPGHGRVVQITAHGLARLADGAVASLRDDAWVVQPERGRVVDLLDRPSVIGLRGDGILTREQDVDGLFAHTPPLLAELRLNLRGPGELATGAGLICARGRRGDLACGRIGTRGPFRGWETFDAVTVPASVRAAQISLAHGELWALGYDGHLSRAVVPRSSAEARTPLSFSPMVGLGDVTEVAISDGADCVRLRGGEVWCSGGVLEHGGVVRRDVPVSIRYLDAAERVVSVGERMCALQRGKVWCWGVPWSDHPQKGVPGVMRELPTGGSVTALDTNERQLCYAVARGPVRCTDGDPDALRWLDPIGDASTVARSLVVTPHHVIVQDDRAQAWFAWLGEGRRAFERVPVLDGYERIVGDDSMLVCGLREGRARCARPDDPSGVTPWMLGDATWREEVRLLQAGLPNTVPVVGSLQQSSRPSDHPPHIEADRAEARLYAALGRAVRATMPMPSRNECLLGVDGRVACLWRGPQDLHEGDDERSSAEAEPVALVPGLADAVELAVTPEGLACARRATGSVVCWGHNADGILTAAEREPGRNYRLTELLDSAPR